VAALTVVAAATGLTWVNCGADYTRYLPKASSTGGIVGWTVAGAGLAVLTTIMLGFALSARVPDLASAANPVAVVREALPVWMAVPILVTAVVGLLAGGVTALYSSGMSLLTLGVPVPRYASVIIDGTLAAAGAAYLLFVSASFITWFQNFVQLATIGLAAWAGIMLVWIRAPREAAGPIDPAAAAAWLAGLAVGVLFSSSPLFVGPLAIGLFAVSGLSYVLCLVVSAVVYALLSNGLGTRRPSRGCVTPAVRRRRSVASSGWSQSRPHRGHLVDSRRADRPYRSARSTTSAPSRPSHSASNGRMSWRHTTSSPSGRACASSRIR
jgi:purine-cytosine permease-like protein